MMITIVIIDTSSRIDYNRLGINGLTYPIEGLNGGSVFGSSILDSPDDLRGFCAGSKSHS